MEHFKVKFGAEGCSALIPGGLVAMEESAVQEGRVQAHIQALYAISTQPLEDDLHAISKH